MISHRCGAVVEWVTFRDRHNLVCAICKRVLGRITVNAEQEVVRTYAMTLDPEEAEKLR